VAGNPNGRVPMEPQQMRESEQISPGCRRGQRGSARNITILAVMFAVAAGMFISRDRLSAAIAVYEDDGGRGIYLKIKDHLPVRAPNVPWETATPASAGLDGEKLAALTAELAEKGTRAFIVVRNGKIVAEYYAADYRPDRPHFVAAMGKFITAAMAVGVNIADGRMSVDDSLREYIPAWNTDPSKYPITVRHILTHSSGIENVSLAREHDDWKQFYRKNPDQRFDLVINEIPVIFTPGSQYEYSGVGFYALAYAMGKSLTNAPDTNAYQLLRNRIMSPLGIPPHDWSISYNESYAIDGMTLYAIGSGGYYTPRAIARVGQLAVNRGRWEDRQLIPQLVIDSMLEFGASPSSHSRQAANPAMGLGLWLNCDSYWPKLPADAAVAAGGDHQILLIVPSLNLVAVRLGNKLGKNRWEGDYWTALGSTFLEPLIATVLDFEPPAQTDNCMSPIDG